MGGRGASSGMSVKGKPYGSEYHTVFEYENIKFVVKNNGAATAPLETRTKGRIYVTVGKDDKLKSISFYGSDGKRVKQIDLDHPHKVNGVAITPHVHYGYYHNDSSSDLSNEDKVLVDKVYAVWNNRHG